MKLNSLLQALIVIGIIILLVFTAYELFLKPSEVVPGAEVIPITSYYGEDVLQFLQNK